MSKFERVLSNDELLEVFVSKKEGSSDYNALDVMQWAQEAVLAKLHEQEPVATIQVDSVNEVGITYHQFQGLYDGMKLYAAPKERHRSTKNHIPDAGKMVAPHGYRLVSLADIDTAIQRASVFDDGGDGADPESARSCIEILKSMLKGDGTFIDEGTKEHHITTKNHIVDANKMVTPLANPIPCISSTSHKTACVSEIAESDTQKHVTEEYKRFCDWCDANPSFDLDSRLHTSGGTIDNGGYISDEKTRIAFAAWRAAKKALVAASKYTGDSNE